jgi:hypothetical protein
MARLPMHNYDMTTRGTSLIGRIVSVVLVSFYFASTPAAVAFAELTPAEAESCLESDQICVTASVCGERRPRSATGQQRKTGQISNATLIRIHRVLAETQNSVVTGHFRENGDLLPLRC